MKELQGRVDGFGEHKRVSRYESGGRTYNLRVARNPFRTARIALHCATVQV